jgi:glycosyltransferase involved in cell wall biosynthesis
VIAKREDPLALSVVIPVLNAERGLAECLASIRRQEAPPGGYEIVIADGGSTDSTQDIAESAGARVVDNPYRKAEPGVAVGMQAAIGRFITVMAADNRMRGQDFMLRMLAPFEDTRVVAAFPRVVSTAEDGIVNRYFNRYSDPFNHFVYGSTNTSIDLMLRRGERRLRTTVERHPLLAVAQGCTVRAGIVYQESPAQADDVLAIVQLIAAGGEFALIGDAELEHHHASGLAAVYQKYSRRTSEALGGQQGYLRRASHMTRMRRLKRWFWIPYSASIVAPAIHGALMALRYRDSVLLFHPVVNTVVFAAVLRGAIGARFNRSQVSTTLRPG